MYENDRIAYLIEQYIHSKRNRRIMHDVLIDGVSMEQVAMTVKMSTRQIKRIVDREERELLKYL